MHKLQARWNNWEWCIFRNLAFSWCQGINLKGLRESIAANSWLAHRHTWKMKKSFISTEICNLSPAKLLIGCHWELFGFRGNCSWSHWWASLTAVAVTSCGWTSVALCPAWTVPLAWEGCRLSSSSSSSLGRVISELTATAWGRVWVGTLRIRRTARNPLRRTCLHGMV